MDATGVCNCTAHRLQLSRERRSALALSSTRGYDKRMSRVLTEHIDITPGVCGGKPRIAGHRVRVMDIVLWHERCGWSPDDIVSNFPQMTLGDVHAALAYYFDHRQEIQADLKRARTTEATARKRHPSKLKKSQCCG